MTTPTGTISLRDVNIELGLSASARISLNDTDVRDLAGKPSGQIALSDLRGKSAIQPSELLSKISFGLTGFNSIQDVVKDWTTNGALIIIAMMNKSDPNAPAAMYRLFVETGRIGLIQSMASVNATGACMQEGTEKLFVVRADAGYMTEYLLLAGYRYTHSLVYNRGSHYSIAIPSASYILIGRYARQYNVCGFTKTGSTSWRKVFDATVPFNVGAMCYDGSHYWLAEPLGEKKVRKYRLDSDTFVDTGEWFRATAVSGSISGICASTGVNQFYLVGTTAAAVWKYQYNYTA